MNGFIIVNDRDSCLTREYGWWYYLDKREAFVHPINKFLEIAKISTAWEFKPKYKIPAKYEDGKVIILGEQQPF